MVFKKIIFQNRYVALESPRDPPPFMANTILNFNFDYLTTRLSLEVDHNWKRLSNTIWELNESRQYSKYQCVLASQGAGVYIRGTDHIHFAADRPNLIRNVHLWYKIRASFFLRLFSPYLSKICQSSKTGRQKWKCLDPKFGKHCKASTPIKC